MNAETAYADTSADSRLTRVLFPLIPGSPEKMVQFLFWHSICLTATTPLSRMLKTSWDGKLIVQSILNLLGIPHLVMGRPAEDSCLKYPESDKIDRAFGPHAFFGLLWIVAAYMHICQKHDGVPKRVLGHVATAAFVLHMAFAAQTLIIDPMEHHPLNWMFLLSDLTVSSAFFALGMEAIAKRNAIDYHIATQGCHGEMLYLQHRRRRDHPDGCSDHAPLRNGTFVLPTDQWRDCYFLCLPLFSKDDGNQNIDRLLPWIVLKGSRRCGFLEDVQIAGFLMIGMVAISIGLFIFIGFEKIEESLEVILSPFGKRSVAILVPLIVGIWTFRNPGSPVLKKLREDGHGSSSSLTGMKQEGCRSEGVSCVALCQRSQSLRFSSDCGVVHSLQLQRPRSRRFLSDDFSVPGAFQSDGGVAQIRHRVFALCRDL